MTLKQLDEVQEALIQHGGNAVTDAEIAQLITYARLHLIERERLLRELEATMRELSLKADARARQQRFASYIPVSLLP